MTKARVYQWPVRKSERRWLRTGTLRVTAIRRLLEFRKPVNDSTIRTMANAIKASLE